MGSDSYRLTEPFKARAMDEAGVTIRERFGETYDAEQELHLRARVQFPDLDTRGVSEVELQLQANNSTSAALRSGFIGNKPVTDKVQQNAGTRSAEYTTTPATTGTERPLDNIDPTYEHDLDANVILQSIDNIHGSAINN